MPNSKSQTSGKHSDDKVLIHFWASKATKDEIEAVAKKEGKDKTKIILAAISKFLRDESSKTSSETSLSDLKKELEKINVAIAQRDSMETQLKAQAIKIADSSIDVIKTTILGILSFVPSAKSNQIAAKIGASPAVVFQALSYLETVDGLVTQTNNDEWRKV